MATKDGEKTGGRKKGVPNKRSNDLAVKFDELNFDPIAFAIKLINGKGLRASEKLNGAIRLAEFIHAKRKALEVAPDKLDDQAVEKVFKAEWGSRKEASDAKEED